MSGLVDVSARLPQWARLGAWEGERRLARVQMRRGDGHQEVRCVKPDGREKWYRPQHLGPTPTFAYPPPVR
jgi:hypothetical protein